MTYPSIIDKQQPLHFRNMTQDEVFRFGQLCAACAADGQPLPVDRCGYVNDDAVAVAVAAWIQASTEVASVSA
nr:hypothetical protein [Rhodococcus wratislaviensis]GLK40763.1 hypothetical protein GCM10017611_76380 [Rhodococcus wratislaviensis]